MSTHMDAKQARLNELYELGKSKGVLTYDEIINKLSSYEIDPDQFDNILETIEAGANAITWTPPSNGELFRGMMEDYRAHQPHHH